MVRNPSSLVPSGHAAPRNPEAIKEVDRILKHLPNSGEFIHVRAIAPAQKNRPFGTFFDAGPKIHQKDVPNYFVLETRAISSSNRRK